VPEESQEKTIGRPDGNWKPAREKSGGESGEKIKTVLRKKETPGRAK